MSEIYNGDMYPQDLHNNTSDKQGGSTNEYYHLTASELVAAQNIPADTATELAAKATIANFGMPNGGLSTDGVDDYGNAGKILNLGTGDFTFEWFGEFGDVSTPQRIFTKYASDSDYYIFYYSNTSNQIFFTAQKSSIAKINLAFNFTPEINKKYHIVVSVDRDGTRAIYVDGALQTLVTNISTTDNVDNTGDFKMANLATFYSKVKFYLLRSYNTSITAAQVSQAYNNGRPDLAGLPSGLVYANKTAVYQSDFSAGTDDYVEANLTLDGNIDDVSDGVTSKDDCLRLTANDVFTYHVINTSNTKHRMPNGLVLIEYEYYIPTTNSNCDGIRSVYDSVASTIKNSTITGAWTKEQIEFDMTGLGSLRLLKFVMLDGTTYNFADAGNDDVVYLKNITFKKAGCLLEYKPQSFSSAGAKDLSGNNYHAEIIKATQLGNPNKSILYDISVTANVTHLAAYKKTQKITGYRIINNTANAVTVNVGTTASGTDIMNGIVVGASLTVEATLNIAFATDKDIYISAADFNSANLEFTLYKELL